MKISGYEVEFPHQPYGVQLSFMSRVLQTIEHRQNALLEAPTGSGKTLESALLGSVVAEKAEERGVQPVHCRCTQSLLMQWSQSRLSYAPSPNL